MSRRRSRLRSYRRQGLDGVSLNGYTYVLLTLVLVPLGVISVEYRAGKSAPLGIGLCILWIAALIASIVVATIDDYREGTGRWYGRERRHKKPNQ